jgi:glycosyltransferase involved in cell wall biosynthesis
MAALFIALGGPRTACSRIRLHQYIPYLAAHGLGVDVEPFYADSARDPRRWPAVIERTAHARYVWARMRALARQARRYDLVVLQRVLPPRRLQDLLRRSAKRLMFDFDDAIYTTHAGAGLVPFDLTRRFEHMLGLSDGVIVATPHLAERARRYQARVSVIPSPVDCDRFRPQRGGDQRTGSVIGWIGSPSTAMYLDVVLPVLERLTRSVPGTEVVLVGANPAASQPARRASGPIRSVAWSLDSEVADLARFDIGIMPQADDEWAKGKGGYKLLQYMACGLPSVATACEVSRAIIDNGVTGRLVSDATEWDDALRWLLASDERRHQMGCLARQDVERRYALERWAPVFHDALASVTG